MKLEMPIGDLCVLRDTGPKSWSVAVCKGGDRQILRTCRSREEAAEAAMFERDRIVAASGNILTIQFPDDCTCCRECR